MPDSVFFQGSLQDGINLAIQQSKMVLAFVTDSGDESQLWENELLTNDSLKAPLEHQAVALRLQAGSEEAGFLEALFPIPKKPTVVIIQNGTLKEYIQGGTAKEDLVRRIAAILSTTSGTQTQQPAATSARQAPSQPHAAPQASTSTRSNVTDDLYDDYDIPARPAPVPAESSQQGQNSQEARRLEAEKKAKEAKEAKAKAEREAKAQERRRASESNEGQSSTSSRPERSYAEEVRQQKIRAAEDRKRILKRIEDDKRERREREAKERQARLLLSSTNDTEASSSQTQPIPLPRRQASGSGGDHCNLQVRLFDGSTIRSRFKSDATLGGEVRKWIDEDRTDGDAPYTFRIVLTPLPNKAVEPSEESQSLQSLGLPPSATLVLVPAKYSSAFARASDNLVWRSLAYILGFFSSGYGFLSGLLGGLAGLLTGRGAAAPEEVPLQNLAAGRTVPRIRGFDNAEERRRDAQLYNGNSVS
ncbi:hypothetical protein Daesc_006938 [Daldinia eschscholtzii]|uniref:UBX domain-containing protein 2 n=1 Tax=Daldinia eschscholtzii TaxID=292717 RepID=A0AAX6MJP6_9PEZI